MSNIVSLLIIFLMLMFVSLFWHQLFRVSPEESLVLTGVFVMLTVFCGGLFRHASIVFVIMAILAIAAVLCFIGNFSFVKVGPQSFAERILVFVSPSICMFTLLFGYCIIAFKGAVFTYPDEVYQWGPAVRYMAETEALPYGASFTGQEITLSMATMFQYIWVGLNTFIERNCFIGNFLLAFIPVFLPFSRKGWESCKAIFLYTITIFLAVNVFTYIKYYNLLQDIVLPLWAGSIVAWLLLDKRKKLNWWLVLGSVACISAMKSMVGPLFAGVIILVAIIRQVIYYAPIKIREIAKIQVGIISVLTVISTFGISFVWSLLIGHNVHNRFIAYDAQAKSIKDITRGIINKSFAVLNNGAKTVPNLSYVIMFFVTLIFIAVLGAKIVSLKEQKIFKIVFSLYAVGFIVYLTIMLYAYIAVFGAGDSESIAGLERYLSYYMLLGSISIIAFLYAKEDILRLHFSKTLQIGVVIILLFATSNDFISRTTTINQKDDPTYRTRSEVIDQTDVIKGLMEEEGKIFVLGTVKSDIAKMLTYELGPIFRSDYDCFQLYTRSLSDAVILKDIIRYPSLLNDYGYDYLWVYTEETGNSYDALKYYYGMPDLEEGAFYKIVRASGKAELEYLGNIKEE